MVFDSNDNRFKASGTAMEAGDYVFTVTCSQENYTTETESVTVSVTVPENRMCGVEADILDIVGNDITGTVENKGTWKQNVIYNIIIDGFTAESWTRIMEPGEKADVDYSFSFNEGTHFIRLEAYADCGSYDKEDTGHFVLYPYSCFNPPGIEGQEYCDYEARNVKLCSAGQWIVSNVEYCYSCGIGICGDGALNCGETKETCPRDWLAQNRVDWQSTHCSSKWLDEYRCHDDTLQREYRDSDCDIEWKDYKECEYGCDDGRCEDRCEVDITGFDYVSTVSSGSLGYVIVTVENLGEEEDTTELVVYVDGTRKTWRWVDLEEGEEAEVKIYYSASSGAHEVKVSAFSECGNRDDVYADVYFQSSTTTVSLQPQADPVAQDSPAVTDVDFGYNSIDMLIYDSKAIPIEIQTSEPQDFRLYVSGVPSDWTSHDTREHIENEGRMYVYLTPKEAGPDTMTLKVVALGTGEEFLHSISIYVAGEGQAPTEDVSGGLDMITGNIIMSAPFMFGDNPAVAALVAVIFFAGLGFGLYSLREELDWRALEAKYCSTRSPIQDRL
jgi:hypothetical protein